MWSALVSVWLAAFAPPATDQGGPAPRSEAIRLIAQDAASAARQPARIDAPARSPTGEASTPGAGGPGGAANAGTRPPGIHLEQAPDGRTVLRGLLPPGLTGDDLAAALPGVGAGALRQASTGSAEGWEKAILGLSIVLPRLRNARVRVETGRIAITGELRPGFSAEGARAALRAALERSWRLSLDLAETEPAAGITLRQSEEGARLSGLLPGGLDPDRALALLGGRAAGAGLAGGGAGDAAAWAAALGALAPALDLFARAEARMAAGEVALTGVLRPGYPPDALAARLGASLPAGWRLDLNATGTPPSEGDRRANMETGEAESFRRGFWLPDLDFPVSAARCRAEADRVLAAGQVPFAAGAAEIDAAGRTMIDRLAAIAVRCLNSSEMRLEIAGHTESAGNDRRNQALSMARAEAVRRALLERGVRPEALSAAGYGESRPVATNDTAEGRARNRRIEFDWSGGESERERSG